MSPLGVRVPQGNLFGVQCAMGWRSEVGVVRDGVGGVGGDTNEGGAAAEQMASHEWQSFPVGAVSVTYNRSPCLSVLRVEAHT